MEFFKTKKGELIFSEIAMRPGGGKIIKTFELKTTVNLINMLCSLEIEQKKTMKLSDGNDQVYGFSFLPFPQKNFSKKELTNDLKELFKDIVSIDIEWDETGYPTIVDNSYTRFGQIVVKGNTSESVDSILDKILKYYGEKYL